MASVEHKKPLIGDEVKRVTISGVISPKLEKWHEFHQEDPYQHMRTILAMSNGQTIRAKTPCINRLLWFSYRCVPTRNSKMGRIVHEASELKIETPPLSAIAAIAFPKDTHLRQTCENDLKQTLQFESEATIARKLLLLDIADNPKDWRCALRSTADGSNYLLRMAFEKTRFFYTGIDDVWQQPTKQLQELEKQLRDDPRVFLFKAVYVDVFPKVRQLALDTSLDEFWKTCDDTTLATLAVYRRFVKLQTRRSALYFDPEVDFPNDAKQIAELVSVGAVHWRRIDPVRFYLETTWQMQASLCRSITNLLRRPRWEPSLPSSHRHNRDYLHAHQRAAVEIAEREPLCCIPGPPGSGKSEIPKHLRTKGCKILLLAPTGCASCVLSTRTDNCDGWTIDFVLTKLKSIPLNKHPWLKNNRCVIDEAVMLDLEKAEKLLYFIDQYCPKMRNTILIGDPDQLPPIGMGKPYVEMIDSRVVPTAPLTHIHRLIGDETISIKRNARRILDRDTNLETNSAFIRLDTLSDERAREILREYGTRVTFTAYYRKTVEHFNQIFMSMQERQRLSREGIARGQRIVFRQNKYSVAKAGSMPSLIVANGMTGIVEQIADVISNQTSIELKTTAQAMAPASRCRRVILNSNCGRREIDVADIPKHTIENADARTVHTFQGGQNEVVVVIMEDIMSIPELYTAVTRAQKRVYLIGTDDLLLHIYGKPEVNRASEMVTLLREKNPILRT